MGAATLRKWEQGTGVVLFLERGGGQHVCMLAEMMKSHPGVARRVGARAVLKRCGRL